MRDKVNIAAVQMNPVITENRKNLDKVILEMGTAAGNGADLIVFPECALTGYVFASREEALPFMETVPGPSIDRLSASCKELGVHVIVLVPVVSPDVLHRLSIFLSNSLSLLVALSPLDSDSWSVSLISFSYRNFGFRYAIIITPNH